MDKFLNDLNEALAPEHRIFWMVGVGYTSECLWAYGLMGWKTKKNIEGNLLLIDNFGKIRCVGKDQLDIILQLSLGEQNELGNVQRSEDSDLY